MAVVTFAVVCGLVLLGWTVAALREVPREPSVVPSGVAAQDIAQWRVPGVSELQPVASRRSVDHNI